MYEIGDVLTALARKETVTDDLLEDGLGDLCNALHACDCPQCPVYRARDGQISPTGSTIGCDTFKDGRAMLNVLRGGV